MAEKPLTVALVGGGSARAAAVEAGVAAAAIGRVVAVPPSDDLPKHLGALGPDVVVVALDGPAPAALDAICALAQTLDCPVVVLADRSDVATMQKAVDAGIAAYVVGGLDADRVKSVLELALARFEALGRLRRELVEAKTELADRKLIERAKGVVMKAKNLDEQAAYTLLRRTAMNDKRKLVDVARAVLTAAEILE